MDTWTMDTSGGLLIRRYDIRNLLEGQAWFELTPTKIPGRESAD